MSKKPPSQRRIGARIRIRPEYAESIATLFSEGSFVPIHVEHRADGDISFWFDKAVTKDDGFIAIVRSIPFEAWAIHAIVGHPTFH